MHRPVEEGPVALMPPPAWFWSLPVLVTVLWWPFGAFWASDDFVAVHYAQDLGRALADFAGPQYGAQDIWFFYRPLITLSFWFDTAVGGGAPFASYLSNTLAHALSALLVGLLWRRMLEDPLAFAAALLWAIAPGHAGTVSWAVGRVDGHTALWILLSVWLFVRWLEGGRAMRLLSLLAMVPALLSKELAMCLPGLIALCAFAKARGGPLQRTLAAVRGAWLHALVLCAYLVVRILLLGRFGGYTATEWDAAAMAHGLGAYVLDLVNPLHWCATPLADGHLGGLARALPVLGWLPPLLGLGYCCLRPPRLGSAAVLLALFLCASVPLAPFLAGADNHHNLRLFYLPLAALTGILVAPGLPVAIAALLLCAPAFVQARHEQWQADRTSAQMHARLLQMVENDPPDPWLVAGLPRSSAAGAAVGPDGRRMPVALQYHFGVDRILEPPFGPGGLRVLAHRPMQDVPGAVRLLDEAALPVAPHEGSTMLFDGPGQLTVIPPQLVPSLPVEVEGGTDLSSINLQRMKDTAQGGLPAEERLQVRIRTPGFRAPVFRVTFFTPTGYLATIVPDHAAANEDGSAIDLFELFRTAKWAGPGHHYVIEGLCVAATLDLEPEYPVLVEAGRTRIGGFLAELLGGAGRSVPELAGRLGVAEETLRQWIDGLAEPGPDALRAIAELTGQSQQALLVLLPFTATHRARQTIAFRFDRELAATVRRMLGQG